jgi:hypothetical protein
MKVEWRGLSWPIQVRNQYVQDYLVSPGDEVIEEVLDVHDMSLAELVEFLGQSTCFCFALSPGMVGTD